MEAIVFEPGCEASGLVVGEVPDPVARVGELLVAVKAAGVNRADVLQRRGLYPPPPGGSQILGLEIAGEVVGFGPGVEGFKLGQRVFGLVQGGGYGRLCCLHQDLAMTTPDDWSDAFAAAVPEVFFTAHENLIRLGRLSAGEEVLIHAGGSGVGSTAIQMARCLGARIATTVSAGKAEACARLGAELVIDYHRQDFVQEVRQWSKGGGVHVILDFLGASYLARNLDALRRTGRLAIVGLLGGARAELNLGLLLGKELQITGSVLRALELTDKIAIKQRFLKQWMPRLLDKSMEPIIYEKIPFGKAHEAHKIMEGSNHFGKLILSFDGPWEK